MGDFSPARAGLATAAMINVASKIIVFMIL
jgi:hypothetical protein